MEAKDVKKDDGLELKSKALEALATSKEFILITLNKEGKGTAFSYVEPFNLTKVISVAGEVVTALANSLQSKIKSNEVKNGSSK